MIRSAPKHRLLDAISISIYSQAKWNAIGVNPAKKMDIDPYIPGFIAAYSILLVGASSPGPSVAMLVGIATEQGRIPALLATLGIALGSVTINILTILGVGFILSQAAWAMVVLRIVGAIYLLYLAYNAFKKAVDSPPTPSPIFETRSPCKNFAAGYLLQVTNPKTIAFWLAISSVGAVDGASVGIIMLFIFGGFIISFSCHGAWAFALSINTIRAAYFKARRKIETALGCFFAFAAYKIASA
ncbi:MAG: LysE family translocator [Acidiferrobacterales bacterium]|nr:LysE family translocator [Acidiferrobacterales bacterium]